MHLGKQLLRFFLPWACAGCHSPLGCLEDEGFCGRCWLAIPRIQGLVCQACGLPLIDGGRLCYRCRDTPPPLLIRAATQYHGIIPGAVYRFKYAGRKSLDRPFGTLLRYAWESYPELHTVQGLIPVPLYSKNERTRGFNQAELLTAQLAKATSRPLAPFLVRIRKTPSQVELNRKQRQENMAEAFALEPLLGDRQKILQGRSFLLIDDVCTTTSTLAACARVLYRAGVRSVKALVLARDL